MTEGYDKDLNRLKSLTSELHKASVAYYQDDKPFMSDKNYDDLYDELEALENKMGISLAGSPTHTVGCEVVSKLEKVTHSHPMLSLGKTKSPDDLVRFSSGKDCVISLKMDGCFKGDQRITMSDGSHKSISSIKEGEYVLSLDENGRQCAKKVIKKYKNGEKPTEAWTKITIDNNKEITCTKDHKFLTPNYSYKKIDEFNIGDALMIKQHIPSKAQQEIILGILLGDGHFVQRGNLKTLEVHYRKTKQNGDDDLVYKLNNMFKSYHPKITNRTSGYSKVENNMTDINFHAIEGLPDYFFSTNNRLRCGFTFTEEICEKLSPLSLAIYYLDDGSKMASILDGYKNTSCVQPRVCFHTNRHKKHSVEIFQKYLRKMGIESHISLEKEVKNPNLGDGYIISLTPNGTKVFCDLICKYIPKAWRKRKLPHDSRWQDAEEIKWWNDESIFGVVETKIKNKQYFKQKYKGKKKYGFMSYDLEIEDTHCYMVQGVVVHNCTTLCTYQNGELVQAETRGNGEIGELITHNAKVFEGLPLKIPFDRKFEIEGESIIRYSDFEMINQTIKNPDDKYKNPRNLASGSVRQLDSNITKNRHVRFVVWKVPFGLTTFTDGFRVAAEWGFEVVPYVKYNSNTDDINKKIEKLKQVAKEKDYPIDGLVITYDNIEYGKSLGMTSHHPRHSLAFKFYEDEEETTVRNIEWSMGRTGVLTPVAVFDDVELAGTTVNRASLHNVSIMNDLKIGIGDRITIYKANEIIPQVRENLTKSGNTWIPLMCPVCGFGTEIIKENDTEILRCKNPDCQGKLLYKLSHFASRNALNIEGLSESTIQFLLKRKWVSCFKDLYHLKGHEIEWKRFPGFGPKSVTGILAAIEKSRETTLDRFLYGLSIPMVGKTASEMIAKACDYDFNTFMVTMTLTGANFFNYLDGVGPSIIQSLDHYFNIECSNIFQLSKEFNFNVPKVVNLNLSSEVSGKTFVITGSVEHFANRDAVKDAIVNHGGKVVGSVSAKVDYLVNNDINSTSSKNKKAKELGVKIITEDELIKMLGD